MQQHTLLTLGYDDLQTLIIDSVKAVFDQRQFALKEQHKQDDLLTVDEAAAYLHLAKQTIYERTAAGSIPHMKQGKRLYFSRTELTKYIAQGKRSTAAEAAKEVNKYLSK